jgi:nitrous oxidase accessory protein
MRLTYMKPTMIIAVMLIASAGTANAETITVSKNGRFTSVRQAVTSSQRGDVVYVEAGVFIESNIVIRHPLELRGRKGAVIDGSNTPGTLITVKSDSVLISDLELRNVAISYVDDNAAIKIVNSKHCEVLRCRIFNGFFAIYLSNSQQCRIADNYLKADKGLESNSGNGIHCWTSKDVYVSGNIIDGHRDGIYFEFMNRGTVIGNTSRNNLRYGLHFMFSDSCTYSRNKFIQNGAGVAVMFTHYVQITDNTFSDNWGPTSYGLLLKEISDSHLRGNLFDGNTIAIHGEGAARILLEHNVFRNNGYALRILGNCFETTVRDNTFEGNTFDVTTNSVNSQNTFINNYWSSYSGYDLNKDGFGDVPFHPVRLYSLLVEQVPSSVILMHTPFVNILDLAERVLPTVTPETLVDSKPRMSAP